MNELLRIPLFDELIEYERAKPNNSKLFCFEHNIKKTYICFNCSKYYCSRCLIMNKHDSNHFTFNESTQNLVNDYYDTLFKINQPVLYLKDYIDNKYLSDLESKITELQKQKNEQITFYKKYIDYLTNRFDTLINNLIKIKREFDTFKDNYNKQCNDCLSTIKELVNNKNTLSKENIDNKYLSIIDIVYKQEEKILPNLYIMSSSPFEVKENKFSYTIHNYSLIIKNKWESKDYIYSPIYIVDYLSWKVRINPWGSSDGKDTHISIYLFLTEGGTNNKYNYDFKFELVNFKGKQNYNNGWTNNDFEPNGIGWGYPQFYKLEDIENDGYIDDEGNLTINCYIKPSSIKEIIKAILN